MSWTNERIELLQKLWFEGWSASRIAGELACGITRNAVIGKVYRLGLSGRANALPGNVPASPPHHKASWRLAHRHANSPQVADNTALALPPFVIEAAAPQTVRDVVVLISEPVTIVELCESMCHWPIGDPAQSEFRFCGAKKLSGQGPYCACHAGIAYQTQHDRRRGGGRKVGLAPSPMIAGPWPVIRFATERGLSRLAGTEPHTAERPIAVISS